MFKPNRLAPGLTAILGIMGCLSCNGGNGKTRQAADAGSPEARADAGSSGFIRCIEDWPTSNGPHPIKPSLMVDAPQIAWRTKVNWGLYRGGIVVSKDRLAFPTADHVFFVGKDGSDPQKVAYNALGEPPSELVADTEGNIYYVAQSGVYSVDAAGELRWKRSLGGSSGSDGEYAPSFPPVLGPDGVVYAVTSSRQVFALNSSDGKTLWSQPAPGDQSPSLVLGGAGRGLFLSINGQQVMVLDTEDGETIGGLSVVLDGKSLPVDSPNIVLGWSLDIEAQAAFVFDSCGHLGWSTYDTLRKKIPALGLITPGELVVSTGIVYDGSKWLASDLRLYGADGKVVASETPYKGANVAVGADGTIYTIERRTIFAYSMDLKELWHLDLGSGTEVRGMVVLDDDGMMYLVHESESTGTEVVGIQTRSPGLADSSWPSLRHDNRGTAWLVPGVATGPASSP